MTELLLPQRELVSLTLKQAAELAPPSWLVKDTLPDGGLSVFAGAPGIGKTFAAVDLALCVAYGRPWLGYDTKAGRVVYVAAEGYRSVAHRMLAWCKHYGLREQLTDNLIIIPDGVNLLGGKEAAEAFFGAVEEHFPVETHRYIDDDGVEQSEPMDGEPIRLVIFDTLARCVVGGDENAAEDMGKAIAFCDYVRKVSNMDATVDTHVMLIHHTNKAGTGERGSTALRGACDTLLMMNKSRAKAGVYNLTAVKQRDGESDKAIAVRLMPVEGTDTVRLAPAELYDRGAETAEIVKQPVLQLLASARMAGSKEAILSYHLEVHDPLLGCSLPKIGKMIGMSSSNVSPRRAALVDEGYLRRLDNKSTIITPQGVEYLITHNQLPPHLTETVRGIIDGVMATMHERLDAELAD
jgi:hypothetical protein